MGLASRVRLGEPDARADAHGNGHGDHRANASAAEVSYLHSSPDGDRDTSGLGNCHRNAAHRAHSDAYQHGDGLAHPYSYAGRTNSDGSRADGNLDRYAHEHRVANSNAHRVADGAAYRHAGAYGHCCSVPDRAATDHDSGANTSAADAHS